MKFKQFIQDYFAFSRNERRGITILLVIIFLLAIANKIFFYFETPVRIDTVLFDSARNNLGLLNDSVAQRNPLQKFFRFNPNTIDSIGLSRLDLPESVKQNLLIFRSKGGKFYIVEDFSKIDGVTDSIYKKIAPYLVLKNESNTIVPDASKTELFMFDPNKSTNAEFYRLGLSEKQIASIRDYQNKGGSFKGKKDFFKILGLNNDQKKVIGNYLVIESVEDSHSEKKAAIKEFSVELNSADTILLKQLPGIGEKLSKRIVQYRDLLGGFYSVKQLTEVYGLGKQTILKIENKLTVDITKIRKLDLNFSKVNELSRHPYLQNEIALKIIKFRTKNGRIHDLSVLRDSLILNVDEYNRLKPYF